MAVAKYTATVHAKFQLVWASVGQRGCLAPLAANLAAAATSKKSSIGIENTGSYFHGVLLEDNFIKTSLKQKAT